ncbi:type I polyketide synthase [Actinosynnema sp. NPDC091369]
MNRAVAIIGAACRLPGAPDVASFWELLLSGGDAVGQIPPARFDVERWYDPVPGKPGRIVTRVGGFLPGVDRFDAAFFGVSPQVAARTDPQQRLLVETTWDAVEDAGIPAERLAGSATGVYTSCWSASYWDMLRAAGVYDLHAALSAEPGGTSAGFLSHHLDLRGPAMGLNATCASSLFAVHAACRALRSGEIDLAIVAGANLLLSPDSYFAFSEAEMLSPTGRWRFGDVRADGYVRSEGVLSLVLKPLDRALADGDRVYAAIAGSAANNDGRTGGTMLAPGLDGQVGTLRAAYRDAGLPPGEVDYVEAHGTGTPHGDPVELAALAEVLREGREPDRPCLVGSAKSNIGHTESAAGLVGLLKAALVLHHGTVPPTLHVERPQPELADPASPLRPATGVRPLPARDRPPVAGVSAFGLSGASAHVVLTGVPARPDPGPREAPGYLVPLSAPNPAALAALAGRYADLLDAGAHPVDLSHGAATRRTRHAHRLGVVGTDRWTLAERLRAARSGMAADGVVGGRRTEARRPDVVFVFPGQGSQWPGMARDLLASDPVFRAAFAECDRAVLAELGWSPAQVVEEGRELTAVDEVQPVLWAVQVALAAVWRHWGVEPTLLIGHSMGEIAAATTAGALTPEQGAAVVCRRAALLAQLPASGAMWAVHLGERDVRAAIADWGDRVEVGVVNSDHATVLSGDADALDEVAAALGDQGVHCRRVPVDYASHGRHVDPMLPELAAALADLAPRRGRVPLWSTALTGPVDGRRLDAGYWVDNLRLPVRFADAVRAAVEHDRPVLFVEISPHPVLTAAIEDGIGAVDADAVVVASTHRDRPALESLLTGVATAYAHGYEPSWERLAPGAVAVPLPAHPWQRRRFWVEEATGREAPVPRPVFVDEPEHPLEPPAGGDAPAAEDLAHYLVERTSEVLGMSAHELDVDLPLHRAGLDSLLAARLRGRIRAELGVQLSVGDLLGGRTLTELADTLRTRTGA